jgi:DCN1-like protein 1/2
MTYDGVVRFLKELSLPADSIIVLILAWKMNASTQCEFTRDEFLGGMTDLGVDSVERLRDRLPGLEREILMDKLKYKSFYQFTFQYAKEPTQKSLDLETAITYWNIVLSNKFRFLGSWIQFLQVRIRRLQDMFISVLNNFRLPTGKPQPEHPA